MIFPYPAPQRDPRRSRRAEMVRRLRRRVLPEVPDVIEDVEEPEIQPIDPELIDGIMRLGGEARIKTLRVIAATQGEERATQIANALTAEIQKRRNAS